MDLGYTGTLTNKRILMNHTEIGLQYGKLHALYETMLYLQKQIKIENEKLEQLKKKELTK
tara:strand:+ start:26 stop:205 length:180 start_codon:yes stop_codon:yes gene_type:complete